MRRRFVVAIAILSLSLAARAGTITESYSASGTAVLNASGSYGIDTTSFADFDTSLGTLDSITIDLSGEATNTSDDFFNGFADVTPGSDVNEDLVDGNGATGEKGPFAISADATDTYGPDMLYFEGSGTQEFVLNFDDSATVASDGVTGTLTYNYTPSDATVVPEPSSFVLLSAGLLGVAGILRKRLA
jgi:hypothetical protein